MIALSEEVFDIKNDSSQLEINEEVLELLNRIHPATVSELNDGSGPYAWKIVIPTTERIMLNFLEKKLTEMQILKQTLNESIFDSIYLCSALVLQEYRRKGIVKKKVTDSI